MGLGYLSKALRRAGPALATVPLGIKPAARTGSPLAEEDQRLHDTPELTAPTAQITALTDAPVRPPAATTAQETELAPPPAADSNSPQSALAGSRMIGRSHPMAIGTVAAADSIS